MNKGVNGLLTVSEMLAVLGGKRSRRWLLDQAREERIPALKVGGEWFFHLPTILAKQRGLRAGPP